ncbi:MAG: hypothetical protein MJY88_02450 [Bacteroidales bacterium]|nr:hypothetical protein [Bacteroidales bacterium]
MKYTKEIFDSLSRGGFVCSNSVRQSVKRWYEAIEDDYDSYKEYFDGIGFTLESGNGYYYFTRVESKVELNDKLERFSRWIDRLDFVKTFNSAFGPGFTFQRSNILEQMAADIELKDKATKLYKEKMTLEEVVEKLVDEMEKMGFIELENELDGTWKVTSAFHYIEELVDCLIVSEEVENEVSE